MGGGREWGLTNIWNSGVMWGIAHFGNSEGKGSLNYGNHLYMVCYGYFLN